jgi:hypothetical protein
MPESVFNQLVKESGDVIRRLRSTTDPQERLRLLRRMRVLIKSIEEAQKRQG